MFQNSLSLEIQFVWVVKCSWGGSSWCFKDRSALIFWVNQTQMNCLTLKMRALRFVRILGGTDPQYITSQQT
jgi:hypothetical protein